MLLAHASLEWTSAVSQENLHRHLRYIAVAEETVVNAVVELSGARTPVCATRRGAGAVAVAVGLVRGRRPAVSLPATVLCRGEQ